MTELSKENPVVAVAREHSAAATDYVTESGVKIRVRRISPYLIAEVQGKIVDPPVPNWHNPDKDRDEPNPNDPAYQAALQQAKYDRARVGADAALMFGLELVDGLPSDTSWLKRLAILGIMVDPADEFAIEFAYKKYIAVNAADLQRIGHLLRSGPNQTEVATAIAGF